MDVIVNSFIATIDVVQNSVDLNLFIDYCKTNMKKEIVFINAQDFAESIRVSSKIDAKGGHRSRHDAYRSVVKGIKTKIDTEKAKMLETKKKWANALEKQRATLASGKSSKSRSKTSVSEFFTHFFDNKVDILFIILNSPYLPAQLNYLIKEGIKIDSFFAFVPAEGAKEIPYVSKRTVESTEPTTKKASIAKKTSILGSEYDYSANPNVYPPARWLAIKPTAPPSIAFIETPAQEETESLFKELEDQIVKLVKASEQFREFENGKNFIILPSVEPKIDLTELVEYLIDHPGDYINAILYRLQKHNWSTSMTPPQNGPKVLYNSIFKDNTDDTGRKVVYYEHQHQIEAFYYPKDNHVVLDLLYNIKKWKLNEDCLLAFNAISNFIMNPDAFHAYAGQKFDLMVQMINKKYMFGLPLAFYDWQKWSFSVPIENVCDTLVEAIHDCLIIESILEQATGILWLLVMKPITRVMGQYFKTYQMPNTMNDITEWINNIFGQELPLKKSRQPPTPANIVKNNMDHSILFPPFVQRFENSDGNIYKLPISVMNHFKFYVPYLFDTGLNVQLAHDMDQLNHSLSLHVMYKDIFEILRTPDSITFIPVDSLKLYITQDPYTINLFFNEQSITYDGNMLNLKTTGDFGTILISDDGSLIKTHKKGLPIIIKPDGTIGQQISEKEWIYTDSSGEQMLKKGKSMKPTNAKHTQITDAATGITTIIRPDGFEYYINPDGSRKIIFEIDFTIEQSETEITYDIPTYPIIHKNGSKMNLLIDRYNILIDGSNYKFSCDEFSIEVDKGFTHLYSKAVEYYCDEVGNQFRSNDDILVADSTGVECLGKTGQEIPNKKKIEVIDSKWGKFVPIKTTLTENQNVELHKIFVPRFFAIRSDLSATEFCRPDTIDKEGVTTIENQIPHPTGCPMNIISFHHPEKHPQIYVQNNALSKPERINLLKNLHIPKPAKKSSKKESKNTFSSIQLETLAVHDCILDNNSIFFKTLSLYLEKTHEQYLYDLLPPEPIPDPVLIIPPETPKPRLLEMQHQIYEKPIKKPGDEKDMNYWKSRDSSFAYPLKEDHRPETPLSARIALRDPPRFFKPEKARPIIVDEDEDDKKMTKTCRSPQRTFRRSARPKTAACQPRRPLTALHTKKQVINFGNVKVGDKVVEYVIMKNNGKNPLHFHYSPLDSNELTILTPPGVISPGLSVQIKVELYSKEAKEIDTSFRFQTPESDVRIPITANIIE